MLGHPSLSTLKVLSGTSLERQIRTSAGRQIGTSPGWSNRILRGRPGEVEGGRPWDVLGTNMCLEISFILQLWHHNIIAVVKRKIRASFEPLASKKAVLWELKYLRVTINFYEKYYLQLSPCNKKHSSKKVVPITFTIEERVFTAFTFRVCGSVLLR